MFQALRKHWRHFLRVPPGRRFQEFYEERQSKRGTGQTGKKWLIIVMGLAMALGGALLLPLPGPGSIVLVGGLALLSSESLTMARLLDFADKRRAKLMASMRRLWKSSMAARCLLVAAVIALLLLAGGAVAWLWMAA